MSKKTIGECAKLIRGVSYKKQDAIQSPKEGYIPILRANNIVDNQLVWDELIYVPREYVNNSQYVRAGDVIITMSSGSKTHVGKVALANKDYSAAFGAFCGKLVCEKINPKYLTFALQSRTFRQYIESASKGTNINNLKQSHILSYEIEVPQNCEQERIVSRIEELFSKLDASVAELQTAKEKLKVYRQAVYSSVYDELRDLQPITNFFEITGGLTKNSRRNELPLQMPYLRVANVYYNHLDLSEIKEIGVMEQEIDRCLLEKNDLLFVEGNGSKAQIGRVAIWNGQIPKCLHQNHIVKGRPLGNMLSEYALYYLISNEGRKQIVNIAKSTSGLYTLSTNKIKGLRVPYCDLNDQKRILDDVKEKLSVYGSIEQTIDTSLQQAEALRQSILKQAFEGSLV